VTAEARAPSAAEGGRRAAKALAESPPADGGSGQRRFKGLPPPSPDMTRAQLAEQYGPYVRSIAGKIKKTLSKDIEFDDLLSYGMLGLMEAADRFDAKYGANFMTFAYYRIRGAIYDGLRGMGWVSRTEYQKYRFEQHANEYLRNVAEQEAVGGGVRKTEDDEVSDIADAVEGLVTIYVTALDAMEGFQIADDSGPSVDETLEVEQARRLVAEAVEKLPEQERTLLSLYYYKELSLEEVGKHLGLSKSWTSRLHTRAIEKLGRLLKDLLIEYEDERPLLPKKKKAGGRKPTKPAASSRG
jgi:RNA polymerase sigma factor for flagellar operon FliA